MNDFLTFVFDIDGTLCPIKEKNEDYKDLIPYSNMIRKLKIYHEKGARIILFTSRNMNSYGGNIGMINKNTAKILLDWLEKWDIPYDEIIYGKPWPGKQGFYVDDRTIRPDEFLNFNPNELQKICESSRDISHINNENLEIIITMGGLGSRFQKAGYEQPKFMIEAKGKTLFEWSLISLSELKNKTKAYTFIVMDNANYDVKNFIREKCRKLGIDKYNIITLDYLTDGQATTAMMGRKYWNKNNALLIYNIDTYIEPDQIKFEQLKGDGFIPCFKGEGEHWSFVKLNEEQRAVEVKEKERISPYCTLGAYYFKTCELFENLYFEYYSNKDNLVNGEKYVAPLYNYLIKIGGEVYISNIENQKVHVLGTPRELEMFINK